MALLSSNTEHLRHTLTNLVGWTCRLGKLKQKQKFFYPLECSLKDVLKFYTISMFSKLSMNFIIDLDHRNWQVLKNLFNLPTKCHSYLLCKSSKLRKTENVNKV